MGKCKFILMLPLLVVQVQAAGEVPTKISRFFEQCEMARRGAILQLEHQLRGLRITKPFTAEKATRVAQLEEQLDRLRTSEELVIPSLSFPLQTGAIGRIDGLECHLDQVVSRQEVLVRCYFRVPVTTVRNFQAQRDNVTQSVPLLLRGVDMSTRTEGQDIEVPGVFEVEGTERYETQRGGSKEVTVLAPFDVNAATVLRKKSAN